MLQSFEPCCSPVTFLVALSGVSDGMVANLPGNLHDETLVQFEGKSQIWPDDGIPPDISLQAVHVCLTIRRYAHSACLNRLGKRKGAARTGFYAGETGGVSRQKHGCWGGRPRGISCQGPAVSIEPEGPFA